MMVLPHWCWRAYAWLRCNFGRFVGGDYDFRVRDFFNSVWTACRAWVQCNTVLCTNEALDMRHDILSGKQVICTMRASHA